MQFQHQGYVLRISQYAKWLVQTSSADEIREAISERRAKNGDAEAEDLRASCLRLWRQKQLTGRLR